MDATLQIERCRCGCGRKPRIAKRSNKLWGCVAGERKPYIAGHRRGKFTPKPKRPARTHGMSGTPEYMAYMNALYRCTKPYLTCWPDYGGRGIRFCFTSFENFYMELGQRPSPEYSLDRISPNGHYEVGNVRWALKEVQTHNKRGQWIVESEEMMPEPGDESGEILYRVTATMHF
jgi:hypothetical protein